MSELRLRLATRALVLDDSNRVLLVRMGGEEPGLWITPGGGIEAGEEDEHAVRRELLEETGLAGFELGPLVWIRTAPLWSADARWDGEIERVYLVRVDAFDPKPGLPWDALRGEGMTDIRWWTLSGLEETDATFAPRRLPELVRALLHDGTSRGAPRRRSLGDAIDVRAEHEVPARVVACALLRRAPG